MSVDKLPYAQATPPAAVPAGAAAPAGAAGAAAGTPSAAPGASAYWERANASTYGAGGNSSGAGPTATDSDAEATIAQAMAAGGAVVPSAAVIASVRAKLTAAQNKGGAPAFEKLVGTFDEAAALNAQGTASPQQVKALGQQMQDNLTAAAKELGISSAYSAYGLMMLAMLHSYQESVKDAAVYLKNLEINNKIGQAISTQLSHLSVASSQLSDSTRGLSSDKAQKQTTAVHNLAFNSYTELDNKDPTGNPSGGTVHSAAQRDTTGSLITQMNSAALGTTIQQTTQEQDRNNNQRDMESQRYQTADAARNNAITIWTGMIKSRQDSWSQLNMNMPHQ